MKPIKYPLAFFSPQSEGPGSQIELTTGIRTYEAGTKYGDVANNAYLDGISGSKVFSFSFINHTFSGGPFLGIGDLVGYSGTYFLVESFPNASGDFDLLSFFLVDGSQIGLEGLSFNTLYNVCIKVENTGGVNWTHKLFVNGVLIGADNFVSSLAVPYLSATPGASSINFGATPASAAYKTCSVYDFKIFDGILSDAECIALSGTQTIPELAVIETDYQFDEGVGSASSLDRSGNLNPCVLTNYLAADYAPGTNIAWVDNTGTPL